MKTTVTYKGVELTVHGWHEKGQKETRQDPGICEHVVVDQIFIGDQDCTELLESQVEAIEDAILEEKKEARDPANWI